MSPRGKYKYTFPIMKYFILAQVLFLVRFTTNLPIAVIPVIRSRVLTIVLWTLNPRWRIDFQSLKQLFSTSYMKTVLMLSINYKS